MDTPRILWAAKDHPDLNSGYGIMGRNLLPKLADRYGKSNIFVCAPVYERDRISEWQGMTVLPGNTPDYSEDMLVQHYQRYGCNILLHVGDAAPLGILPDAAAAGKIYWVSWIAVDWLGLPKNIRYRIQNAHKLVPFSKYGEASLRNHGLTNVEPAIWIGLDTSLWRPIPMDSLGTSMARLGFSRDSDSLNILIVAANQIRKQIREQLEAISLFRKMQPSAKVCLYLHSHLVRERDIRADVDELGLSDIAVYPEPYMMATGGASESDMVKAFNCADVVLNCAMEGFGLSVTQAQSCGVPAVVMSEGGSAEVVSYGYEVQPSTGVFVAPNQMAQPLAYPPSIAQCLELLWSEKRHSGHPLRSQKAVDFVREHLSWDKIAEQWFGVLERSMAHQEQLCLRPMRPSAALDSIAREVLLLS